MSCYQSREPAAAAAVAMALEHDMVAVVTESSTEMTEVVVEEGHYSVILVSAL